MEDIASESSIICVTESHLDTNIVDNDIIIDGFSDQILRKDRNCFGGGVLVCTSQDMCVKRRYDLNFASGEIIWYEVIILKFKILTCTVYRPLGFVAIFWENFEYSIEQAMNYTSNIIINGDLNVDLLRENNNKLLEIISEFNLTNVIKEPTRNGALLDPILVSNLDIVIDSEVISVNRDISDHDATSAVPHLDLRFNGEPVEIVKNHKHLGLTFASDGNWTNHIDNIVNAAFKQVTVLRKLKFTLSNQTLSNI